MNKIIIDLPKDLTSLAGNSFGREIFDDFIDINTLSKKTILVFPDNIERVAIGFVQGFISKVGPENFKKLFELEGNPKFIKSFWDRIES